MRKLIQLWTAGALACALCITANAQNPPGLATRIKSGTSLLGTPCNSSGGNTDFYIQTSVGVFYCKAGTWQQLQDNGSATHNLLSATHPDTTPASVTRGAGIFGIGPSPTWSLVSAPSSTNGYFKKNSSGDIVSSSGAASGTGACASHNWVSTLNPDAPPGCTQPTLADITAIAADAIAQNASGSSAAPSAVAIPNCPSDGAHALVYSTSSHGWTCSTISGGSGVAVQPIVTKTSGYTVTTSDFSALNAFVFTCTGTCDVTLPASAPGTNGQFVSIKNQGATSIFVMPNGLNLDSSIAPLLIPPKYTATIWTDAANYFSGPSGALGAQSSRRFAGVFATGSASLVAVGTAVNVSTGGGLTNVVPTTSHGQYERVKTSASNNTESDVLEIAGMWGVTDSAANVRWSGSFALDDLVSGVTNLRGWLGIVETSCSTVTIGTSDTPNCHLLAVRCSSAVPDTNWMAAVGKQGASVTAVSTGVACSQNVLHTFAIQEHGGNTAYFYVDGVFKVCIGSDSGCTSTTNYPQLGTGFKMWAEIQTLSAAAKAMDFSWMQVESDR